MSAIVGTDLILDAAPYREQARAIRKYERLHAVMTHWHDQNHAGAYLRCRQEPCRALNNDPKG